MVYSAAIFLPFIWPGRNFHAFAASSAALLMRASPKTPFGFTPTTSAFCTLPAESTITRTETILGAPAVVLVGTPRGRAGDMR